ncbi:GTP-binding protein [Streptomyces sp. NPDC055078]
MSTVKFLVTGGFGAGKTTLIGSVSEIAPLRTEAVITQASAATDSLTGIENKATTTTALDFGRVTFPDPPHPMEFFLFGTPGQDRFSRTWKDLAHGAVGAIVVIDTARLQDGFTPLTFAESLKVPVVVAVNEFANAPHRYEEDEIRSALGLTGDVPVVMCDARDTASVATVLAALVQRAQTLILSPPSRGVLL